jgi:transcriptional regulator with XRE-family HTH domain
MRKNTDTQRFPQSALLFRFCLRVLEIRRKGTKVHDQEVGNILQYNPSDTSHWKRGKKAVRSVYALEALAQALDVDIETFQDIVDGTLDFEEAWLDFAEAEEEKRISQELGSDLLVQRRDRQLVLEQVAQGILQKAGVSSVPVYLPELLQVLAFIQVSQGEVSDKIARSSRVKPGLYSIRCRKGEMRAHTRAAIAREIARVVLYSEREQFHIPPKLENRSFFEIVDFSNALLVPKESLRAEIQKVPSKMNLVKTLSDVFWVPKSIIRSRLAFLLLENAEPSVFTAAPLPITLMGALGRTAPLDLSEEDGQSSSLESLATAEESLTSDSN